MRQLESESFEKAVTCPQDLKESNSGSYQIKCNIVGDKEWHYI